MPNATRSYNMFVSDPGQLTAPPRRHIQLYLTRTLIQFVVFPSRPLVVSSFRMLTRHLMSGWLRASKRLLHHVPGRCIANRGLCIVRPRGPTLSKAEKLVCPIYVFIRRVNHQGYSEFCTHYHLHNSECPRIITT
jgi:hypothetical protein